MSTRTRHELRRLADADGVTLDQAIAALVRAERQRRMGEALAAAEVTAADTSWLELGLRTVADDASR
ncbi:MAG: hypothetical protein GEV08_02665 [Acidimicrobiia bacterium]|nr:hypothetical protein [Acidimicrobiia bacterium]